MQRRTWGPQILDWFGGHTSTHPNPRRNPLATTPNMEYQTNNSALLAKPDEGRANEMLIGAVAAIAIERGWSSPYLSQC
mgnify:FL=1